MLPAPKKTRLIEYFTKVLHGAEGETSAEILADITMQMLRDEKDRALGMCDYHANRPMVKKEFREFAMQIRNSIECGPTYSEPMAPIIPSTPDRACPGYT